MSKSMQKLKTKPKTCKGGRRKKIVMADGFSGNGKLEQMKVLQKQEIISQYISLSNTLESETKPLE